MCVLQLPKMRKKIDGSGEYGKRVWTRVLGTDIRRKNYEG